MLKNLIDVAKRIAGYYRNKQIPLASAALCYYMMMTFFPLIICLYTLLGKNYDTAVQVLSFAEGILSQETRETVAVFLNYVAENHSTAMFYAGLTVLVTSASAGARSIHITINRMQGKNRYRGIEEFLFSVIFALSFLAAFWFAILVMFTSRDLISLLNEKLPFVDISGSWLWIKYLLLGGFLFLLLWAIYRMSRTKGKGYPTWPGAVLATVGMLLMSLAFSEFISASARYSLVYGSMASVILLMLWMYYSCQVIYIGAALNIALRYFRQSEREST